MEDCKAYGKGAGHWCDCGEVDFQELQAQLAEAQASLAAFHLAAMDYNTQPTEGAYRRLMRLLANPPAAIKEIQERLSAAEWVQAAHAKHEMSAPRSVGIGFCKTCKQQVEESERGERLRAGLQEVYDCNVPDCTPCGFCNDRLEALLKGKEGST